MAIIIGPTTPASNIIQSGLLLNLDATKLASYPGSGTTWADISGNAVNGTIVGSPTFTGGIGAYFSMTGDGTYVTVPNATLSHGTNDFTYSTWINFASTDGTDTIFENGSWDDSLLFRFETDRFYVYCEGVVAGYFLWTPVTDTWVNIVFKRESNTVSCYINNVEIGTPFELNVNISITNPSMWLMRSQHTSFQDTVGKLSTFSVYNRALSVPEIAINFNRLKGRYGL